MNQAPITLDNPEAYFARLDAFESTHWWPDAMRRVALGCLEPMLADRSGLVAVDVGCGTGRMLEYLAKLPGIDTVVGVEPEPEAIARSSGRFMLFQDSATSLPMDSNSVDVVTSFDVLQHLEPSGDLIALGEAARVLRDRGILLVRSNAWGRTGYRLGLLRQKVIQAGFEVIRATYLNFVPAIAQEILGRIRRPGRGAGAHPEGGGLPVSSPDSWESRLMGWIARREAQAIVRLGIRFPFGHGTLIVARRVSRAGD